LMLKPLSANNFLRKGFSLLPTILFLLSYASQLFI
jgi:hypothetical protein